MAARVDRLPHGRHIVSLIGDPGPVPGEQNNNTGQEAGAGSTGLLLDMKAFWAEQVALLGQRVKRAETFEELEAVSLALLIGIEHWRAKCQENDPGETWQLLEQ